MQGATECWWSSGAAAADGGGGAVPVEGNLWFVTNDTTDPRQVSLPGGVKATGCFYNLNLGWMIIGADGNGYRLSGASPTDGAEATLYYTHTDDNPVVSYGCTHAGSSYSPVNGWVLQDGTFQTTQGYAPSLNNFQDTSAANIEYFGMESEAASYGIFYMTRNTDTGEVTARIHGRYGDGARVWYYSQEAEWNKRSTSTNTYPWVLPGTQFPTLLSWNSYIVAAISNENRLFIGDNLTSNNAGSVGFTNKAGGETYTAPYDVTAEYNTEYKEVKCSQSGSSDNPLSAVDVDNNLWMGMKSKDWQIVANDVVSISYAVPGGSKFLALRTDGTVSWVNQKTGDVTTSSAAVQNIFPNNFVGFPQCQYAYASTTWMPIIIPTEGD